MSLRNITNFHNCIPFIIYMIKGLPLIWVFLTILLSQFLYFSLCGVCFFVSLLKVLKRLKSWKDTCCSQQGVYPVIILVEVCAYYG